MWILNTKAPSYPKQPLRDGVKFQIRSRMAQRRALFWHEHIGGHQFRLRIRDNNPENIRQWFVFDSRTRTIRAWGRRSHVISNQMGVGFRIGHSAVVRIWRGENYQRIQWHDTARRTIRNNGGKCLDVHGGADHNNRMTTWWNCHNGLNQGWYIDQQGVRYPRNPLNDGLKF